VVKTLTRQENGSATIGTDADDAALAAAGDTRAFERLYRRHVARIHSLSRRMLGPEHADEVTQDAFVRAWNKIGTFRGESAFGTWLYRLATNVILAQRSTLATQRRRYTDPETSLPLIAATSARPDLTVDFEAAIATLPDGAKEIFVLHDIEGYKHEEIAEMLGITAGTSKSQLHRARMMLRVHLA
jgi:RNA polymerase sigma-70 factor (ECF subfamily)